MRRLLPVILLLAGMVAARVLSQDGALPVLENLHAPLPPFTVVSRNALLGSDPTPIVVNGRQLEIPPDYSFTGKGGVGMLPPYIARWAEPGYRFDFSWINGSAGFAQDGIQLYGDQRYVVRVNYTTELEYTSGDYPFVPSDMRTFARIYTANSGMIDLPAYNMQALKQPHEIEWVIESTENPYPFIRLEVLFEIKYPVFRGKVFMEQIRVMTAPADYKPDFVIEFK